MIKYKELQQCIEQINWFNSMAHTEEERHSEQYRTLCEALIQEEVGETEEAKDLVERLDGLADTVFVAHQATECPNISEDTQLAAYAKMLHAIVEADKKYHGIPMFDFYGALMAVCLNNNAKLPLLSEVKAMYGDNYAEAACDWIESQGRYKEVYCIERKDPEGNTRVVFKSKASSGKVLKWAGYSDVDLTPYVMQRKNVVLTDEQFKEYIERSNDGCVKLNDGEVV